MKSSTTPSPVPREQDVRVPLEARIHDARSALRQATDANREVAEVALLKALRDFADLSLSQRPSAERVICRVKCSASMETTPSRSANRVFTLLVTLGFDLHSDRLLPRWSGNVIVAVGSPVLGTCGQTMSTHTR